MDNWREVFAAYAAKSTLVTDPRSLHQLTEWGLCLTVTGMVAFREMAEARSIKLELTGTIVPFADFTRVTGLEIETVLRVAGGFFEVCGWHIHPTTPEGLVNREAAKGWQQVGLRVVPDDRTGVIGIVIDDSSKPTQFLVELRPEAFAFGIPGMLRISGSIVASASNAGGAHGYAAKPHVVQLLQMEPVVTLPSRGDTAREVKRNEVRVMRWTGGIELPANFIWMTRRELLEAAQEGYVSVHMMEALGAYFLAMTEE